MSNELEVLKNKGLTEAEAKLAYDYEEAGKPGIAKLKADQLAHMYVLGYSCQDINKDNPEYSLPMLLWARAKYNWDELRDSYRTNLGQQVVQAAVTAKAESIRFLANLMTATHVQHQKEIMKFIAAPDREKPPEILPKTLHQYGQLANMLNELTQPANKGKGGKDEGASSALVSITVNNSDNKEEKTVIEVNPHDVKESLRKRVESKSK